MQDRVLDILMKESEITWQNIILELIKTEEMNPWDVDVSLLTQKYLEIVKKLQETNFFLSGKILLASAMLVKIKSQKLVDEDILNFDSILFHQEDQFDALDDFAEFKERQKFDAPGLGIRTPQSRKRRVSVKDLITALERALEVNKRRILRHNALWNFNRPEIPERKIDMAELITNIYGKIKSFFSKKEKVTYSRLLPNGSLTKKDKILTLYPLLYLENDNKIDLVQNEHFGEIEVELK
ncbi:MAG: segregation/condensation protein A [Candidatus Woesearchaeota archaeon]